MATSFTTLTSPSTPTITSPTAGATGVDRNPTITSSAFVSAESLSHTSSTWQIATDSGFSSVVWSKSADTTNKTSIVVNSTNGTFAGALAGQTKLALLTQYYVRVKYTDSESSDSAYSTGVTFTIRAATYNTNSVLAQGPIVADKDYVLSAAKPSHIGIREEAPSGASTNGNIVIDDTTQRLYWYNGAWYFVYPYGKRNIVTKTGTYTATSTDDIIICNSATPFTINLPAASGSGLTLNIKNINTGAVTVDGDSSDTIDGETTQTVNQWDNIQIVDYAANKWVIV